MPFLGHGRAAEKDATHKGQFTCSELQLQSLRMYVGGEITLDLQENKATAFSSPPFMLSSLLSWVEK